VIVVKNNIADPDGAFFWTVPDYGVAFIVNTITNKLVMFFMYFLELISTKFSCHKLAY
jgi:hypothetical protein